MVRVGKLGRSPTIRRARSALVFVLASLVAAGVLQFGHAGHERRGLPDRHHWTRCARIDLLPRQPQPVNAASTVAGGGNRTAPATLYEGAEVTAVSDERPAIRLERQRLRAQFREYAGRDRRQGGARRHPAGGLHDRSAGAGYRQPGLGPAGCQVRHHLRAGKRPAAERRGAGAGHRGLPADARSAMRSAPAASMRPAPAPSPVTAYPSCRCNTSRRRRC